jgi:hypothetical protein
LLLFRALDSQADYLPSLVCEQFDLMAKFVSDEFPAFDADMLFAVKVNGDVVSRKADGATRLSRTYQSPIKGVLSAICLLLRSLSFD